MKQPPTNRVSSAPTTQPPSVAIITVSYGSSAALQEFLSSLRAQHGAATPVVVVDNKPDADNVQALAAQFGASYVPLAANPGYGAGMNAGVRALQTPVDSYFFCNPDVRFTTPAAHELSSALHALPAAGAIGPQLRNDDGSVYPSARNIPAVGTGVGHALFSRVWPQNPWSRAYQNAADYARARNCGWLSGAAVMVKQEVFAEIGGWDSAYFMHFEDIDLGWRIGLAGWQNRYEPKVELFHSGGHSTKRHAVVVEQAMTRSAMRFMAKRYPGWRYWPLRVALNTGLRLRGYLRVLRAKAAK